MRTPSSSTESEARIAQEEHGKPAGLREESDRAAMSAQQPSLGAWSWPLSYAVGRAAAQKPTNEDCLAWWK
jgi:hypothetical protein